MTVERLLNLAAGKPLSEAVCCELLSSVGMCAREYLKREADATLSGGERKRIEIATVLAKSHKICIFDEPEAGIDLWSFSMLVDQFERIHEKKQESLLLISHQERYNGKNLDSFSKSPSSLISTRRWYSSSSKIFLPI